MKKHKMQQRMRKIWRYTEKRELKRKTNRESEKKEWEIEIKKLECN